VQNALFDFGVLWKDDKREMEKIPRGLKYSGGGGAGVEQNRVTAAKKEAKIKFGYKKS